MADTKDIAYQIESNPIGVVGFDNVLQQNGNKDEYYSLTDLANVVNDIATTISKTAEIAAPDDYAYMNYAGGRTIDL